MYNCTHGDNYKCFNNKLNGNDVNMNNNNNTSTNSGGIGSVPEIESNTKIAHINESSHDMKINDDNSKHLKSNYLNANSKTSYNVYELLQQQQQQNAKLAQNLSNLSLLNLLSLQSNIQLPYILNPVALNAAAAVAASTILQQQQQQQRQANAPYHPLNQVLLNNTTNSPTQYNNVLSPFVESTLKNRVVNQQIPHYAQSVQLKYPSVNEPASQLPSTMLSTLPSSLQQFYLQLNNSNNPVINHPVQILNSIDSNANLLFAQTKPNFHGAVGTVSSPTTPVMANNKSGKSLKDILESQVKQKLNLNQSNEQNISNNENISDKEVNQSVSRNPKAKYPLECEWSFWFFKNNRVTDWKENLILLTTIDNVEDFWSVYNHLRPASNLHEGCDYMFFKKGIQPMWEDIENRDGGRWLISFERDQRLTYLDSYWLNTLLSLIGSHYDDESSLVNGAVVNIRYKIDKLSLWTRNYINENAQYKIGKRFKRVLGINDGLLIYEVHDKVVGNDKVPQTTETIQVK